MSSYRETYAASLADPESFWGEQAALVDWFIKPHTVLDSSNAPFYRWFPDGTMNTCYNALDRHVVKGRADQAALVYDSRSDRHADDVHLCQLLEKVAAFAGALRGLGVVKGDRVVIYMPMIPEAVVAMLAWPASARCTRSSSAASQQTSWRSASTTPRRR